MSYQIELEQSFGKCDECGQEKPVYVEIISNGTDVISRGDKYICYECLCSPPDEEEV